MNNAVAWCFFLAPAKVPPKNSTFDVQGARRQRLSLDSLDQWGPWEPWGPWGPWEPWELQPGR